MKVALLNVSHMSEAAVTNFRRIFDAINDVELTVYDTRNLELLAPGTVDAIDRSCDDRSVNDEYEYINAAREWLQTATIPIFGVCFGHQLVATAFGGEVAPMPERELGYHRITLDRPTDPLFKRISEHPVVFLCHEDTVVEPPPNATVLASNESGIQALRLGQTVSVQFHPEATEDHARRLLTDLDLPTQARTNALKTVTSTNAEAAHHLRRLFENFVINLSQKHDEDE